MGVLLIPRPVFPAWTVMLTWTGSLKLFSNGAFAISKALWTSVGLKPAAIKLASSYVGTMVTPVARPGRLTKTITEHARNTRCKGAQRCLALSTGVHLMGRILCVMVCSSRTRLHFSCAKKSLGSLDRAAKG